MVKCFILSILHLGTYNFLCPLDLVFVSVVKWNILEIGYGSLLFNKLCPDFRKLSSIRCSNYRVPSLKYIGSQCALNLAIEIILSAFLWIIFIFSINIPVPPKIVQQYDKRDTIKAL